jgi:hypothetical protein
MIASQLNLEDVHDTVFVSALNSFRKVCEVFMVLAYIRDHGKIQTPSSVLENIDTFIKCKRYLELDYSERLATKRRCQS